MKIKGIELEKIIEEQSIIYKCPYCNKKFINKNSIYNHLSKKYCYSFNIDFAKIQDDYKNNKINQKEYYERCYEIGYLECVISPSELEKIRPMLDKEFLEKIESLYEEY